MVGVGGVVGRRLGIAVGTVAAGGVLHCHYSNPIVRSASSGKLADKATLLLERIAGATVACCESEPDFIASPLFKGAKQGYNFKRGEQGVSECL
jgi:hypothetical protein